MPTRRRAFKKGFTLLEVNLAVFIMAAGVLSICALYSLGFRENRQSVEDVAGAAWAELYLSPLVQGLSATNMHWSAWTQIGDEPQPSAMSNRNVADGVWPRGGWRDYIQGTPSIVENGEEKGQMRYRVVGSPRSLADSAWNGVNGLVQSPYKGTKPSIPSGFEYALVVTRRGTIVQLSFRCARRREMLMTMPTYVTEVRFNGDPER